jgi:hypothetical protein
MTDVKSRFLSRRAIGLHFSLLGWLALVVVCSYWQVGRALEGNSLSYLYSIEWPVFGVLGILGWYALLNQDAVTKHQETARREYEDMMREQSRRERDDAAEAEDPALKAYNDHLQSLQEETSKKKGFSH